jgi:NADH-quinone oxidoreductase subunit D
MATTLDFSPAHLAGTQGVGAFGLTIQEDGGLVAEAAMRVGYGRREIEAISLDLPLSQALNFADRVDFLAAPAYNYALASAFEELLRIELPERAHFIRVILLELNRITSHLQFYANLARTMGQFPLMHHCLRERERFSDIFEMYCGSRLAFGAICLGGVIGDATDGWFFKIEKAISSFKEFLPELDQSLLSHPFFEERARGLAPLPADLARNSGITGPNARASGVLDLDPRFTRPYAAYKSVPTPPAPAETSGDVWSRSRLRVQEMLHSALIIESAFARIPSGNHRIRVGMEVRPEPGKTVGIAEGPRGTVAVLAEADGTNRPANVRFFAPSAMSVRILPDLLKGIQVEDAFLVIHSLDISFSEVDK